ncbi:unnamed protein product [Meloidogyne enterolobii]|uniref:Uncharacterized protein n=1 Tax=Meloidogyne enterolobii TaxID=390850 RepID=A0ACB0Y5T2_MELEN
MPMTSCIFVPLLLRPQFLQVLLLIFLHSNLLSPIFPFLIILEQYFLAIYS